MNDLIWKEIQEKNAQFKADNDAYWEAEQVYRKWYAEERKRRCAALSAPSLLRGLIGQMMLWHCMLGHVALCHCGQAE